MTNPNFEPTVWLHPDVVLRLEAPSQAILTRANHTETLNDLSPVVFQAFSCLADGGKTRSELRQLVASSGTVNDVLSLERELNALFQARFLIEAVVQDGVKLASRVRLSSSFHPQPYDPAKRYVPSRFACLRHVDRQSIIESPMSQAYLMFSDWRGPALFNALAHENAPEIPGLNESSMRSLVAFFAQTGLLTAIGEDGLTLEETNETLEQWEFHDLLFHARSRVGRNLTPFGATYRFRGQIPHLPVVKAPMSDVTVPLTVPDLDNLSVADPTFTWTLENRRSQRTEKHSLNILQLGEFLYRTVRLKAEFDNGDYKASTRPYPSGGAMYEIELYLAIERCDDIDDGFYHYCPKRHLLEKLNRSPDAAQKLLDAAQQGMGAKRRPRVLIIMGARFQRLAWKYEAISYALTLKHVGVLHQTFYLTATAMGIAGCAIGAGNPDLFCAAAGIDYYAESSVGEFALC